jgi:hypothetical protein
MLTSRRQSEREVLAWLVLPISLRVGVVVGEVLGLNVYAHLIHPGGAADVHVFSERGRTRKCKPVDEQHAMAEVGWMRG